MPRPARYFLRYGTGMVRTDRYGTGTGNGMKVPYSPKGVPNLRINPRT